MGIPGQIVWVNDAGVPACTYTEAIVALPTSFLDLPMQRQTPGLSEFRTIKGPITQASVSEETVSMSSTSMLITSEGSETTEAVSLSVMQSWEVGTMASSGSPVDSGIPVSTDDELNGSNLFGVSYSPYHADDSCKSPDEIMNDFMRIQDQYSLIRIYGTDCDQVPGVYAAAKAINVRLFLGV